MRRFNLGPLEDNDIDFMNRLIVKQEIKTQLLILQVN